MARYIVLFLLIFSFNSIASNYPIPLPGTSGNVLTSNGTKWVSQTNGAAKDQSYEVSNLSISASVGSSALTIAIKDKSGNDPSSSSPVYVGMRSSTITSGVYLQRSITGALNMTVSSGSTLGQTSAKKRRYMFI